MTLDRPPDTPLDQFLHDVQNCLHVIGLGTELLKSADAARAAELIGWIDAERLKAQDLVEAFGQRARRAGPDAGDPGPPPAAV